MQHLQNAFRKNSQFYKPLKVFRWFPILLEQKHQRFTRKMVRDENTPYREWLKTVGNTGLLSNSLSIKVFLIFYAFDIAIK
ncbi:hypothetical protein AU077_03070 [Streptococcus gallolyticus]|nr:hypothetical protein AU077_03070 [Streptococcus gallolyticus]